MVTGFLRELLSAAALLVFLAAVYVLASGVGAAVVAGRLS